MTTLLLLSLIGLMDLFTTNDIMLPIHIQSMFVFTTIAYRNKGTAVRTRRNETPVDTRPNPPQIYGNSDHPFLMPTEMYSALMGFLVNQGTAFLNSPYPDAFPHQKRLRFSSVDTSFLQFIQSYFSGHFFYQAGITFMNGPDGSASLQTICTDNIEHLYNV